MIYSNYFTKFRRTLSLILFLGITVSSGIFAQKPNISKINGNPIIPDMIADPSILEINGVFYCYATTDGYEHGLQTSGPPVVWKSNDFVNWSFKGIFFPSADQQLYWAPSKIVPANGKYYIYPTINTNIHVAVSDSPEGPFRLANGPDRFTGADAAKPLVKLDGPKGTKGIDAEVFVDDDGQAYMFWAQRGAARLKPDMITLDTSVVVIKTKRKGYTEGPIFFKRKGIYYFLYTLSGHEDYQYAYGYSRVSPLGPFIFPEHDIISTTDRLQGIYGPGHGCVFSKAGTDDFYFSYLEFGRGGCTRQVWVDKMEFNDDGTIKPIQLTQTGVGALNRVKKPNINLALNAILSASSVMPDLKVKPIRDTTLRRIETFVPDNATDGSNGTRWMAASSDSEPWLSVDLGKVQKIKRCEAYFVKPTAGHAFRLEYSMNGKDWKGCGGHTEVLIQSPHIDNLAIKARYLKITILKGTPGLWELKIF
ncbi:MAG: family 43 glycosylhydrolase [Bacteroidetes bacterium]|nr:family 43 glycosylhydrolase [Bacteroidota bacterium]